MISSPRVDLEIKTTKKRLGEKFGKSRGRDVEESRSREEKGVGLKGGFTGGGSGGFPPLPGNRPKNRIYFPGGGGCAACTYAGG